MALIYRQAAIDAVKERYYKYGRFAKIEELVWSIEKLPSAQPKSGHWMIEPTEEPEWCKCSECGYVNLIVEVFALDGYHYCPNCGADMRENEHGTD